MRRESRENYSGVERRCLAGLVALAALLALAPSMTVASVISFEPATSVASGGVGFLAHRDLLAVGKGDAGVWLVAWASGDTLGGTIGFDDDLVFVRSTDEGVTWSARFDGFKKNTASKVTATVP